ncbi:phytoene desaturase family protein [Thermodesulfobacteriota bacterium]
MTDKTCDILIIGAGPNGLALGSYLSKAGLKVLILEKRHEAGGGLATECVTMPDFLHNTHAVYMMMADYAPIYSDLKLEEDYGLEHIYPSLQFALPLSDGRCVCIYSDVEKTCRSIAQFSKHDAEAYREFHQRCQTYMRDFIAPATYVPPVPVLDQVVKLQSTELGREIAELSEKTPVEIVDEFFENEHVKALMLYVGTHWGVGYDDTALGYLALLYLDRAANYRMVKGGTHMVNQALHKVIIENGGRIWNNAWIKRIILEGGAAKGVELDEGTIIRADKAVVSTIDPHQTFLTLVGEENLEKRFVDSIKLWQWEQHSLLGVHLALDEAPDFTAAASNPEINRAFIYVLGYETPEELMADYDKVHGGEMSETACFNCCFPTVHDPTQAPPGRHTGLISRFAPYRLNAGPEKWYDMSYRDEVIDRCLSTLQKYAPNMTSEKTLRAYISTPLDLENKFSNMVEGSFKQGLYHPFQMGVFRPNADCSNGRTPVKNLYLGGASMYPGGCVIWGPGYRAADVVAEDLGIEKWWSEPEIVTRAREKGML